jgi:tryptophan-rich sensory protein
MVKSTITLVAWIAVSFLPALSGAAFPPGEWYAELNKPAWTPPGAVFGPVWTMLYTLMGVSAWLVWRRDGFRGARLALIVFIIQLALNGLWSVLFFGAQSPALAFADIVVLLIAVSTTMILFRRHRPLAGGLLAPYLAWVAFATALNLQLWRLNP